MIRKPSIRLALVTLLTLLVTSTVRAQIKVNGRVERVGPFRLVRVWGTPQEMGMAHGYLLADDIVTVLNDVVRSRFGDNIAAYEAVLSSIDKWLDLPAADRDELEGVYRGVGKKFGADPNIDVLHRRLRLDDLVFLNVQDTLRAFGCSGFTAWADRAGADGVITARNFDYVVGSAKALATQLILVRQPAGKKKVATITFPGFIGAFTGLNESGVSAFMHDGSGPRTQVPKGRYTPVAIVVKDLLERIKPANAIYEARNVFYLMKSPFSYLVRIAGPWTATTPVPAAVFRVHDGPPGINPFHRDYCITTNHYLNDAFKPIGRENKDSERRYRTLEGQITDRVTAESAWRALQSVVAEFEHGGTLHAIVILPEKKVLLLAMARYDQGRFVPAPRLKPTQITFGELFDGTSAR